MRQSPNRRIRSSRPHRGMSRSPMRRCTLPSGDSRPPNRGGGRSACVILGGLLGALTCLSVGRAADTARPERKLPAGVQVPTGVGFATDLSYCKLRACRPCLNVCPLAVGCVVEGTCRVRGCDLKLNVAWPTQGKGPFPAVILIHGGGWL